MRPLQDSFRLAYRVSDELVLLVHQPVAEEVLAMRARRVGTESEYRLFWDEQEIGRVDNIAVSFRGFATRHEAVLAAAAAYHASSQRRAMWRALQGTGISRRMRQFAEGLAPA